MARAVQTYDRRLLGLISPDLLIIDDLGLRPLEHDEPLDLYEVIRQRYERGALIITSNRSVEEWGPLFKDELLASAAVDRLLHHSHVLVMEGETYRNPRATDVSRAIRPTVRTAHRSMRPCDPLARPQLARVERHGSGPPRRPLEPRDPLARPLTVRLAPICMGLASPIRTGSGCTPPRPGLRACWSASPPASASAGSDDRDAGCRLEQGAAVLGMYRSGHVRWPASGAGQIGYVLEPRPCEV
ncbi:ATP-binding protein [Nannocystis pusilla]|uniref:ATP-binding protein n=1 Tax=Nannocystis pusilla TaxID=889268 RepID=UPI003DA584DA